MTVPRRLILILALSAIETGRTAPAKVVKADFSSSNSSISVFTALSSPSYLTPLQFETLVSVDLPGLGGSTSSPATVVPIILPAPPDLADSPVPISTPAPSIGGVGETVTVTTTADPSTVTVPFFLPPETETITNTIIVTLLHSPSVTPSSAPPPSSVSSTSSFLSTVSVFPSSAAPAPSSPAHLPSLDGLAVWTAPNNLKNLDPFNITSFPGSQKNLKIVTGMPAKASSSPNHVSSKATLQTENDDDDGPSKKQRLLPPLTSWTPQSTSLQLLYPANSINPAQKPQGGAEFYASPMDISTARNVSMRFSVYFPPDFEWVLAGKLPGIYGGHTGCSGGNAALDCFSTRLMWRQSGKGELYLYAAKDKQTKALCADPLSVCDAAYGFSIGRGSFTWAAGAWTTVTQTVVLNTPGKQDGAFTLDVNGERVIEKTQVFYRDVLWPVKGKTSSTHRPSATTGKIPSKTLTTARPSTTTKGGGYDDDPLGDILGPLLSEIGHLIRRGGETVASDPTKTPGSESALPIPTGSNSAIGTVDGRLPVIVKDSPWPAPTPYVFEKESRFEDGDRDGDDDEDDNDDPFTAQATPQREGTSIGFIGIFFSTFFGGHDDKYATPKDQYVWFKDFAMSYNA